MNKLCQKRLGSADAKVDEEAAPDDQCKKLICQFTKDDEVFSRTYPDWVPKEGSFPCGEKGVSILFITLHTYPRIIFMANF
jgi:hypothetical protein